MGNKIMAFECGLYKSYDCKIKRKYSQDRSLVILPEEFTCLIVPSDTRDEVLGILGKQLYPIDLPDKN